MSTNRSCENENLQEYETLRNEIISVQEIQRTVWIYMYVLFGTLFVLGLEWSHYLFLVTYIILIPFQCVINDFLWSVSKISTYIRVFFEDERYNMNWESFHIWETYQKYYKKKSNSLIGLIKISGSTHLGFIATMFFCGYHLRQSWNGIKFVLNGADLLSLFFSIILFFALLKVNFDYKKSYYIELEKIMKMYRQEIKNKRNI